MNVICFIHLLAFLSSYTKMWTLESRDYFFFFYFTWTASPHSTCSCILHFSLSEALFQKQWVLARVIPSTQSALPIVFCKFPWILSDLALMIPPHGSLPYHHQARNIITCFALYSSVGFILPYCVYLIIRLMAGTVSSSICTSRN